MRQVLIIQTLMAVFTAFVLISMLSSEATTANQIASIYMHTNGVK